MDGLVGIGMALVILEEVPHKWKQKERDGGGVLEWLEFIFVWNCRFRIRDAFNWYGISQTKIEVE